MSDRMNNRNCLSYWFPRLEAAGLPVPKTRIITTGADLMAMLDGKMPLGLDDLVERIRQAALDLGGFPVFLRTGQTSNKHHWKDTCFLASEQDIEQHVFNLVEFSEMCDIFGIPYDVWVVRELLPVEPVCVLPAYRDMPAVREFRCFVADGEVQCVHPYWPREAVAHGFPRIPTDDWADDTRALPENFDALYAMLCKPPGWQVGQLARRAGRAVGGEWSVDVLWTTRGWYITDMAVAADSYHWEDCKRRELEADE